MPVSLEELVLQSHLRVRLETNTGPEDVGQSRALLGESIDHRGAGGSQRSLEHVAEDTENTVESLVLLVIR